MLTFLIGLVLGIILAFAALLYDASKDKPTLVWMDEDYKLHLIKKRK